MKQVYKLLLAIVLVFLLFILLIAMILLYCGPLTTAMVKYKLKKSPTRVVVSLTTTPYRIATLEPVLDSIIRQSIQPTKIYLNIPWVFKRENVKYVIPKWLKNYPNVFINRTKDYGPATKLIATLEKEHDPQAIIITVDDDHIYSKHVIRDLIKPYVFNKPTYKDAAVTGWGLHFVVSTSMGLGSLPLVPGNGQPSLLVMGVGGVAYRRDFFKKDIFSLTDNIPISCFLSDDLMISAYLLAHNINIMQVLNISYNPIITLIKQLPTHVTKDALQSGANGVGLGSHDFNYDYCLKKLPEYHKAAYQKAIIERSQIMWQLCRKKEMYINIIQVLSRAIIKALNKVPYSWQVITYTMQ